MSTSPISATSLHTDLQTATNSNNVTHVDTNATAVDPEIENQTLTVNNATKAHDIANMSKENYNFDEKDVKNITSALTFLDTNIEKTNIKLLLHTKIRNLIVKILQFLGNEDKANQLYQQGAINLLKELKPLVRDFYVPVENRCDENFNQILAGTFWVLSPELMEMAKGDLNKLCVCLNRNPEARQLFKKNILSINQNQFQTALENTLGLPTENFSATFNSDNQIFKDTNRSWSITFDCGDTGKIEVNPRREAGQGVSDFQQLEKDLEKLPTDTQEKIKKFCRGFCAQGMLALHPPILSGAIFPNHAPHITAKFEEGNKIIVSVVGKVSQKVISQIGDHPFQIPTTGKYEFSYEYNLEDGSGTNVKVKNFKQDFDVQKLEIL